MSWFKKFWKWIWQPSDKLSLPFPLMEADFPEGEI